MYNVAYGEFDLVLNRSAETMFSLHFWMAFRLVLYLERRHWATRLATWANSDICSFTATAYGMDIFKTVSDLSSIVDRSNKPRRLWP